MNTKSILSRGSRLLASLVAVLIGVSGVIAEEGVVPLNVPTTLTGDVTVGLTRVSLPFTLGAVDRLRLDVIVPVNGATLSLLDPAGAEVLGPGGPAVQYTSGEVLKPGTGLPGGVFVVEDVLAPRNGVWTLVVNFPAATEKTVIVATVLAKSRFEVGVALSRSKYVTGEDVSIGLIALDNGTPIGGLLPTLRVRRADGTGNEIIQTGLDNGAGPDGLAGDGIYSVLHTFTAPGFYEITGTVDLSTPGGAVRRTVDARVEVVAPGLVVRGATATGRTGTAGCIEAIDVALDSDFAAVGDYAISVCLRASNGNELIARVFLEGAAVGRRPVTLSFPSRDLRTKLGVDGPYTVCDARVFRVTEDFELQYQAATLAQTPPVLLSQLCRAAVEVESTLSVAQRLRDGMIDQLSFTFPITLAQAGSYSISLKVTGAQGEDIILIGESRSLFAGQNNVTFNVPGERFLKADGPYAVVSVLVLGSAGSAQSSRIGATGPLSRWQFFPRKTGDLNDDGVVNAADNTLLLPFRNLPALVPGDRRDLNRDRKIDLRDLRELVNIIARGSAAP